MRVLLIIAGIALAPLIALWALCALIATRGRVAREDYWLRDPKEVQGA